MTALVDSAVLIIGLLVLVLGLLSGLIRRTVLSESALAFSAGLLLGPAVFGVVDLADYGPPEQLLEQVARLTLAVGLMVVALRLPRTWIPANARALALLLVAGMAGM